MVGMGVFSFVCFATARFGLIGLRHQPNGLRKKMLLREAIPLKTVKMFNHIFQQDLLAKLLKSQ
ncbi:hypothetical protein COU74_01855 [Candidatus Peregrinibacteria bacterium CG10_big_fil_rev_8_21_14_0_10_36_19]|nr:MAG: hypothetical protein COU74_01855 [Candidatus Peregrinibacteria bacterium CG10_big_fil_rev_8_21_14_0_10_36_19]